MADEQRPAGPDLAKSSADDAADLEKSNADGAAESPATGHPRPGPRPSPAASAASRARRIGGATRATQSTTARTVGRPSRAEKEAGVLPPPPSGPPRARSTAVDTDDSAARSDASSEPKTAAGRPDAARWLTWAPAAVLVAGALAMAVVIAVVSHGVWWGDDSPSQRSVTALRQQVLAAAKTCVVRTNSYKYTDLDTFEKDGAACTTGGQTAQFRKAVDTLIRKNAPKLKFTQAAQINKAGIESVSGNQWTVLVYGQLQVSNVNAPSGRTDPFGAIVRMDKVGGKWLIASLRTVSSPVN